MTSNGHMDARKLHSRLSHPVIDADGHWLEYPPAVEKAAAEVRARPAVRA